MDWGITIRKVRNGYILEIPEEDTIGYKDGVPQNVVRIEKAVIEEINDDDEKEGFKRLIEFIADHFGFHHDKWAKDNLRISWDLKGRKVDD